MDSSNTESVAVIANEGSDKQLMSQLLRKAGYNAGLFDSSDSADIISDKHSAMIVCHRQSHSMPQPGLPQCVDGQRIVVFSDCNAEQTIVRALENGAHHPQPPIALRNVFPKHSQMKTKPRSYLIQCH